MSEKKENISFEDALKDLEKIVDELNNGDMELEKAITAYEKGIKLKNICEERLKNAQERIELIQNQKKKELEYKNNCIISTLILFFFFVLTFLLWLNRSTNHV